MLLLPGGQRELVQVLRRRRGDVGSGGQDGVGVELPQQDLVRLPLVGHLVLLGAMLPAVGGHRQLLGRATVPPQDQLPPGVSAAVVTPPPPAGSADDDARELPALRLGVLAQRRRVRQHDLVHRPLEGGRGMGGPPCGDRSAGQMGPGRRVSWTLSRVTRRRVMAWPRRGAERSITTPGAGLHVVAQAVVVLPVLLLGRGGPQHHRQDVFLEGGG